MLKQSFLLSFFTSLVLISLMTCSTRGQERSLKQEEVKISGVEILPIKESKSCNNIQAIADIMFGEGENQTYEAKRDLGYFLISESIKGNRTLCEELKYRMPGGALKYSSMHANLGKLKHRRAKSYAKIYKEAERFWAEDKLGYKVMSSYNHYIANRLALRNPPSWFKYYIVKYKISGDHVFVDLDFKDKHQTRKSGKYLNNYKKLIEELS